MNWQTLVRSPTHPEIPRRMVLRGLGAAPLTLGVPGALTAAMSMTAPASAETPYSSIHSHHGASQIPDRETFVRLSQSSVVSGGLGARELKFLITGVKTSEPTLYFMNSHAHKYHYDFLVVALGVNATNDAFNRAAYFSNNRLFLAGSVMSYDAFQNEDGSAGLYTIEFWPTDPIDAEMATLAYDIIRPALFGGEGPLSYHPRTEMQQELWDAGLTIGDDAPERAMITSDALFGGVSFSPLNLGSSVGRVRFVDGAKSGPLAAFEIAVFKTLPNDLGPVAGVISAAPQTPLSHVNLRAQQNGIPNAYVKNVFSNPEFTKLDGKIARLDVTSEGVTIKAATQQELDEFLAAKRPAKVTKLSRDLSRTSIVDLDKLGYRDAASIGAKAANVAELGRLLRGSIVPSGFAIPFSFYDEFMTENSLYEDIAKEVSQEDFKSDISVRKKALSAFRKRVRKAKVSESVRSQLSHMHASFPPGTTPRCRSSANSEDLIGFSGAGLYNSYTHREDEGHIEKSIKQVWASLWTLRAFDEREFYRIDHMSAAMGVLVHPNFDDEIVNGVALTRNIYFPQLRGFYVNAQKGEARVTNPEDNAVPEEILFVEETFQDYYGPLKFERITIRRSNLVGKDAAVLSAEHGVKLVRAMERIQTHFAKLYGQTGSDTFAMDIEFKLTKDNKLSIKQARPWAQSKL